MRHFVYLTDDKSEKPEDMALRKELQLPKVSENNEADNTAQRAAVDSTQSTGLTNVIATPFTGYPQIVNNKVTYPVYPAAVNGNPSTVAITRPIINNGA